MVLFISYPMRIFAFFMSTRKERRAQVLFTFYWISANSLLSLSGEYWAFAVHIGDFIEQKQITLLYIRQILMAQHKNIYIDILIRLNRIQLNSKEIRYRLYRASHKLLLWQNTTGMMLIWNHIPAQCSSCIILFQQRLMMIRKPHMILVHI